MIHVRTAAARRRHVVAPAVATAAVTALAWTASSAGPADTAAASASERNPAVAGSLCLAVIDSWVWKDTLDGACGVRVCLRAENARRRFEALPTCAAPR